MNEHGFPACGQCPTRDACQAARFCVTESRFGNPDRSIGQLTCRSCGLGSESAWACTGDGKVCDAHSDLWGLWFIVRMYADDARRNQSPATGAGSDTGGAP